VSINTIDLINDEVHLLPEVSKPTEAAAEYLEVDLSNSVLDEAQQEQLKVLIQKFQQVFAKSSVDIGHTNLVEHSIQLKEGTVPTRARPYPVAENLKPILRKQIQDLLEAGVITQSAAPSFVSPIIMVKKKDGSYRPCIDFRKLNECTVKNHQLLPTIPDVANILARKRYFTSLDLASGYWQVGMNEASQDLTTFITPDLGLFKWTKMPFGLTNAPASFQ
jgi:hypothetical protein